MRSAADQCCLDTYTEMGRPADAALARLKTLVSRPRAKDLMKVLGSTVAVYFGPALCRNVRTFRHYDDVHVRQFPLIPTDGSLSALSHVPACSCKKS